MIIKMFMGDVRDDRDIKINRGNPFLYKAMRSRFDDHMGHAPVTHHRQIALDIH